MASVTLHKRHRQLTGFFRYLLYLVIGSSLMAVVGVRSARLAMDARTVNELKEEMRLLETDNRRLTAEVVRLESLERIEREAIALGMVKPEKVQPLPLEPLAVAAGRADGEAQVFSTRSVTVALAAPEAGSAPDSSAKQDYFKAGVMGGLGELGSAKSLLDSVVLRFFSWLTGK